MFPHYNHCPPPMLPTSQYPPGSETTLIVPNRMVEAGYNYSLIQEKILNNILKNCQKYIDQVAHDKPVQLDLFGCEMIGEVGIKIDLRDCADHDNYRKVIGAAQKMCSLMVEIPVPGDRRRDWLQYQSLFDRIMLPATLPGGKQRYNYFYVFLEQNMASHIINIDTKYIINKQGQRVKAPMNYTTFMYEHCMNAKCKYTPRLYKMLCSFKVKGSFDITLDEVRRRLGLGKKYKTTEALLRKVIEPAEAELKENADCWLNTSDYGFYMREAGTKKITGFRILVHTAKSKERYDKIRQHLINTLKTDLKFRDRDIETIRHYLEQDSLLNSINEKMHFVHGIYMERMGKETEIKNITMYMIQTLDQYFKNLKNE